MFFFELVKYRPLDSIVVRHFYGYDLQATVDLLWNKMIVLGLGFWKLGP